MKPPPRQPAPSRVVELSLVFVVAALVLAWYFLRSPPPAAPLPSAAQVAPVAEATPPLEVSAPAPRSTLLLVNLNAVFSSSRRTQAENDVLNKLKADAVNATQSLSGGALMVYIQATQTKMTGEFEAFRSSEINRIIAVIQGYRQTGGFKNVYDSGDNHGQSYGLELRPSGVSGYDGTADILAILNQATGP